MKPNSKTNRRKFFQVMTQSSLALAAAFVSRELFAQSPKLPPRPTKLVDPKTNQTAVALGYVHDRKDIDKTKHGAVLKNQPANASCKNCQFYQQPKAGTGGCQVLPGFLVKENGWCMSWAKKMG